MGKLAHSVVLSDDPTAADPQTLDRLRVTATFKEDTAISTAPDADSALQVGDGF
jgi:hypothetical protein